MPVRIYAHVTWTTWGRLPLIDASVAAFLERFLPVEGSRHGARLIVLGVVRNHVHMLLELPSAFDIPRLLQGLKGASARVANRDGVAGHDSLRWAQGYDLRSVSPRQLAQVAHYVRDQAGHHPASALSEGGDTAR